MGLASEQLAQITSRVGVVRLGTGRLGAVAKDYELKADGSGQWIWNRPVARDGDPDDTASGWTTSRE
jgi:hypothetical protein